MTSSDFLWAPFAMFNRVQCAFMILTKIFDTQANRCVCVGGDVFSVPVANLIRNKQDVQGQMFAVT